MGSDGILLESLGLVEVDGEDRLTASPTRPGEDENEILFAINDNTLTITTARSSSINQAR
jgi:hypothetical protein